MQNPKKFEWNQYWKSRCLIKHLYLMLRKQKQVMPDFIHLRIIAPDQFIDDVNNENIFVGLML